MEEEVVTNGWLTSEAMVNFIAVAESTPGPIAVNLATYIGSEMGGVFGAFCATLGVVLPSFVIILIVARFYEKFRRSKVVDGCMTGIKPCVVGLIGAAAVSVFRTVFIPEGFSLDIFTNPHLYVSVGIFAVAMLMSRKKLHPIAVVCFSAAVGIACGYLIK